MTRRPNIKLAVLLPALAVAAACGQDSLVTGAGDVPAQYAKLGVHTHGHRLTAIAGMGEGHVNLTTQASQDGFAVEVQVSVRGTEPNAEFLLTRAADFEPDGNCTGTNFSPLPLPDVGELELLTTSAGGAGAKHVSFAWPASLPSPFVRGGLFDVHWEIRTADRSTVLRSPCITVMAR